MQTLMQDESKSPTIIPPPRKRKQSDMSKEDVLQSIFQELSEIKTVMRRYEILCFKYGISIALLDSAATLFNKNGLSKELRNIYES